MNIYGYIKDEDINNTNYSSDVNLYFSFLTSAMPLAAGIGAIFSSNLMTKFGRRMSLILTDLLAIVGW